MISWDVIWSTIMVVLNAVSFVLAIVIFNNSIKCSKTEPKKARYFCLLRIMGMIFITVALYRSVFVSSYPNRLAWYDTILNSAFVIRCLATFAEISFISMIAVILKEVCRVIPFNDDKKAYRIFEKTPILAVGCIVLAQFFAFVGLITQFLILFAIEEALWGVAFLSITPLVLLKLKQAKKYNIDKNIKIFLTVIAIWCIGYSIFQWGIALPFIHFADLSLDVGRVIPVDALKQTIFNFTATRDFKTWGGLGFFIWHSGYFSLCVWMSLLFMMAPREK